MNGYSLFNPIRLNVFDKLDVFHASI